MGRGRQKAKHTKVARDLKYFSPDTNYDSLAKELGTSAPANPRLAEDLEKWPEFAGSVDPYAADYAQDEFDSEGADESKSA